MAVALWLAVGEGEGEGVGEVVGVGDYASARFVAAGTAGE
jgi:hypothetical protein